MRARLWPWRLKNTAQIFSFEAIDISRCQYGFRWIGRKYQESMTSLYDALILSLIGIFALLVLIFTSFIYPFVIMTTIPLGLIGFSISFALHQRPTSFLALDWYDWIGWGHR